MFPSKVTNITLSFFFFNKMHQLLLKALFSLGRFLPSLLVYCSPSITLLLQCCEWRMDRSSSILGLSSSPGMNRRTTLKRGGMSALIQRLIFCLLLLLLLVDPLDSTCAYSAAGSGQRRPVTASAASAASVGRKVVRVGAVFTEEDVRRGVTKAFEVGKQENEEDVKQKGAKYATNSPLLKLEQINLSWPTFFFYSLPLMHAALLNLPLLCLIMARKSQSMRKRPSDP